MDNDLMARRLRPPSEPPRPHNGHSPLPPEAEWSPIRQIPTDIPWDKPATEPWPPAADAKTNGSAPSASVAPPPIVVEPASAPPTAASSWDDDPVGQWDDEPVAVEASAGPAAAATPAEVLPVGWDAPESFSWLEQSVWDTEQLSIDVADEPETTAQSAETESTDETAEPEAHWFETSDDEPAQAEMSAPETEMSATDTEMSATETEMLVADFAPPATQTPAPWDDVSLEDEFEVDPDVEVQAQAEDAAEAEPEAVALAAAQPETEPELEQVATVAEDFVEPPQVVAPWDDLPPEEPHDHEGQPDYLPIAAITAAPRPSSAIEQPELAPWDDLAESEDLVTTDVSVPGRAPWDRPQTYAHDDADVATDDEMAPVVARAVAAAAAAQVVSDPDDALAPVLNDVPATPSAAWPDWHAPEDAADRAPVAPPSLDSGVGPTPPDDLFAADDAESTEAEEPADTELFDAPPAVYMAAPEAEQLVDAETESDTESPATAGQTLTITAPAPSLYSTAPVSPQPPLLLRLELAIVDDQIQVRTADAARPTGPWSDMDADSDSLTPRSPEFEPRAVGAPVAYEADEADQNDDADDSADHDAPAVTAEVAHPDVDPWAAAEAASWTDDSAPWGAGSTAWPEEPPASAVPHDPWAIPAVDVSKTNGNGNGNGSGSEWTFHPSAALAPAVDSTPDTGTAAPPDPEPVSDFSWDTPFDADAPVESASHAEPAAPVAMAVAGQSAASTPAPVSADKSDLWFLSTEPNVNPAASEAAAEAINQHSTLFTAGMTVAMALIVLVLAIAFVYLMTSLLR